MEKFLHAPIQTVSVTASYAARLAHWRRFATATGALSIACAILVLAGWAFDLPVLTGILPGAATMKANTAAGFMLSGLALWLLATTPAPQNLQGTRHTRLAAATCAGLVSVLGALTLAQYIFNVDFGIDDLIVSVANPRMAPATAAAFLLLGLALLLRDGRSLATQILCESCALVVTLIGLIAFLGYAYGVEALYRIYGYSSMAIHTALLFTLLGSGVLTAHPEKGLIATIVSEHTGGLMARRLLPFAIGVPFVLGWLRLQGETLGFYDGKFGLALFAASNILIFVTLVWLTAHAINRLDMQRQGARAALQESSQFNAQIVRSVGEGIVVFNRELHYEIWNEFMEHLSGIPAQDIIGKHPLEIFPEMRGSGMYAILERALAGERIQATEISFIAPASGEQCWLDVDHAPLRSVSGEIIGVIVTLQNVSGRRLAQMELRQANEDLERKVAARTVELQAIQQELRSKNEALEDQNQHVLETTRLKSKFLANMSHELRTPLNAIIGFSELMHDGKVGAVAENHKEYLGDILTSAKHLLQLINDVLDLAKIEAGKLQFKPEPVNLKKSLEEVVNVTRALIMEKHIRVVLEVDPALRGIMTDPARLKQILYNYLSNAIKFSGNNSEVIVRARTEDPRYFRLEVEDHGIGIKPEDIANLFTEFRQLESGLAMKQPGTGLGLAVTKRIAEAQGGLVGVTSRYNTGSIFYAVLPQVLSATTMQTTSGAEYGYHHV